MDSVLSLPQYIQALSAPVLTAWPQDVASPPVGSGDVGERGCADQAHDSAGCAARASLPAMAVAISGGADSAMLAVMLDQIARERGAALVLLHVHHGLVAAADDWALQVQALGRQLGRPVEVLAVQIGALAGRGMEAAARAARYAALLEAARTHLISAIWLAHHRDDQAETVLLRLLRGAGVAGLAAMQPSSVRNGVILVRPWLQVKRSQILAAAAAYTEATGWTPVSDPTNVDPRYSRAAVRTALTPALDARWPGWQDTLVRHARQAGEAQSILDDVAATDLTGLMAAVPTATPISCQASATLRPAAPLEGPRFSLAAWRLLSPARQRNVLRHWLGVLGAQMPTAAKLADLQRQLTQLHSLGHDRALTINHGCLRIRCVRGVVVGETRPPAQ